MVTKDCLLLEFDKKWSFFMISFISQAFSASQLCTMIVLAAHKMETPFGTEFKTLDMIIFLKKNLLPPKTFNPGHALLGHLPVCTLKPTI